MPKNLPLDWFFVYFNTSCPFCRVPEQNLSRCAPEDAGFLCDKVAMLRNRIQAVPVQYTAAQIVYPL